MKVEIEVEVGFAPAGAVQVEMERKTQVPMQATTQVKTRPPVLPDEQRGVLRETQRRGRGESAVCRLQWAVLRAKMGTVPRSACVGLGAIQSPFSR